jgi:dCTP deaminase
MILSAERIRKQVTEEKLIEDFSEKSLNGAGYDLRVGRFYKIRGEALLGVEKRVLPEADEIKADEITLKPGEYLLIETLEKVHMPKNLMARILPRSTLFRAGCSLITAVVDPGYYGTLTVGLTNLSGAVFRLEKGARVGQIVFEEVSGEATEYNGRYQGGKVV